MHGSIIPALSRFGIAFRMRYNPGLTIESHWHEMEITWHGLSCFRLTERGNASVVTDPFPEDHGYVLPKARADIVTVSCDHPTRTGCRAVRGPAQLLVGPGEYEIGNVFVTGVSVLGPKKRSIPAMRNVVFVFDYGGLTVCHLGGLNRVPTRSQTEALGTVDVLLTPIGGRDLISAAQAAEVISMLEPSLVIPMHYHTGHGTLKLPRVSAFLKEMGADKVESVDHLKPTKSALPHETQIVLLNPRQ